MPFTVLIVDDSPVMRAFIRRVMRLAGFDDAVFLEAGNGVEGLASLAANHIDVILTDINMPRMNGEDFLCELRRNPVYGDTPALVISTDATHERVERMLTLGAQGYISKPFPPEALREELDRILGTHHANKN
jgi:two-component system, chemotaxis family, chemotaxis protein CheY